MADDGGNRALPKTLHSMNAYVGYVSAHVHILFTCKLICGCLRRALPIRRCLDLGADIVVTGRCVDSALALGPLMHAVSAELGVG